MENLEKLRPLGPLEQYSSCRHNLGFYHNVAITATYTLPGSSALPVKDHIYRACETLIGQHPILSAIPSDESTRNPYWVRLPEIDLDGVVSFQERSHDFPEGAEKDVELDDLLNVQHNTRFSRGSPIWKLCVLTERTNAHRFTAAFVVHHSLSDGTSAMAFHRTFLRALHDTPSYPKTNNIILSPSTPLLPTMEALHPLPLSLTYLASQIIKAKIWTPSRPSSLWTGSKIISPTPSRIRQLIIPPSSANTLKLLSRKYSSTITSTLQTILARCIFTLLPPQYTSLQCSGAISARRFFSSPLITNDSIGDWVTVYTQPYTRGTLNVEKKDTKPSSSSSSSFPWPIATASRKTITTKLSENLKDTPITLLKYVDDFQSELCLDKVGKERESSFEVTNVGLFDPLPSPTPVESEEDEEAVVVEKDRPKIGRMVFSQSASVIGCAIQVSVITGGDGCLVLVFSWQKGVVEDEFVEEVMGMVEREVRVMGETDGELDDINS